MIQIIEASYTTNLLLFQFCGQASSVFFSWFHPSVRGIAVGFTPEFAKLPKMFSTPMIMPVKALKGFEHFGVLTFP
jgi:hypothetical protein